MGNRLGDWKNVKLYDFGFKNHCRWWLCHDIKICLHLGIKVMPNLDSKKRHYFANPSPSSQSCIFSSGHIWMWELDCEESWVPNNCCFWTVVLWKTLESPLECKEIQPIHSKGDYSWVFIEMTDAKAETPIFCPPLVKIWFTGEDSDAGRHWEQEKGTIEDAMNKWHHRLSLSELWEGDGQRGLACCNSRDHKKSNSATSRSEMSEWMDLLLSIHWYYMKGPRVQYI